MKRLFLLLAILVAGAVGFAYQKQISSFFYFSPCDSPIPYKIGEIDQGFHETYQQLISDTADAAKIWDNAYGKPVFILDSKAKLTVNMIFDERQGLTNQINNLDNQLSTEKNALSPQMQEYQAKVHDFQQKLNDLNSQIAYWNSKGGAPKDVYDQLVAEQNALKTEAADLNQMAQSLNRATDTYNAQVGQLNQTVGSLNTVAQNKPEEGLFDPNNETITIYYNHGHIELVHTLTHELGHALGMGHVTDTQAIMNSQTNDNLTPTIEDRAELQRVCRKQTIFDRIANEINLLRTALQQQQ